MAERGRDGSRRLAQALRPGLLEPVGRRRDRQAGYQPTLVVMDRGKIVEIGNHDALMAAEGHYHKLYMAQARNVDSEAAEPAAPDLPKTTGI